MTALLAFVPILAQSQAQIERVCGDSPGWACRATYEQTGSDTLAPAADWLLGKPLSILAIVIVAVIVNRLARRAVKNGLRGLAHGGVKERLGAFRRRAPSALLETGEVSLRATQRIEALATVLRSIISVVVALVAALMVLGELGVNLAPLLAGAGILGIAIGFGSQALVKDFLSGFFILVEDQFGVGDIVDLEPGVAGTVEAVSLRTTHLRAVDGTVWHVPNGEIRRVGNMSQHWSRALLDIDVAYGTDLAHAREVIKRVVDEIWRDSPHVLEEPDLWGVENLGPHAVTLRLVVKTTPSEQYQVSRQIREQLKGAFDDEGIEIPFPQQTVWMRPDPALTGGDNGGG
jgi:moderate conductance mechanosensitive channel